MMDKTNDLVRLMLYFKDYELKSKLMCSLSNYDEINKIFTSHLEELLFEIYDRQEDKEEWIKRELLHFVDRSYIVFPNENKEFNQIYNQTMVSFYYVPYYLEKRNYVQCFDISTDILQFLKEQTTYTTLNNFLYSEYFLTSLVKNEDTIELLLLIIEHFYTWNNGNSTFLHETCSYILYNYSDEEIDKMRERLPKYFKRFYDDEISYSE